MDIQVYDSMKYLVAESTDTFCSLSLAEKAPHSIREHYINESYVVDALDDPNEHNQWFMFYDWSQDWYEVDSNMGRNLFVAEWRRK